MRRCLSLRRMALTASLRQMRCRWAISQHTWQQLQQSAAAQTMAAEQRALHIA